MFKANNEDTRTMAMKSSGVFIVNFEHTSRLSSVSTADFKQTSFQKRTTNQIRIYH